MTQNQNDVTAIEEANLQNAQTQKGKKTLQYLGIASAWLGSLLLVGYVANKQGRKSGSSVHHQADIATAE